MSIAIAVIRTHDPKVLVADSAATLDRVLAFELVAKTKSDAFGDPSSLAAVRAALLEGQWDIAVAEWISATGVPVDVWADSVLWTQDMLDE